MLAVSMFMVSIAFGQDDRLKLPTPQITDIAYVGKGTFGPRYKIDFTSAQPASYDCTVRLWIVLDRDGQFSYTTNSLGEQEVDTGGDEFRKIPLHGREIENMSYTSILWKDNAEEWLERGNAIYAYAYNDSFSCYSDVSNVVQLPPPGGAGVQTERAALGALYDATAGQSWTSNTNWLTDAPLSEWFGVTTDGGGRVTALELRGNGLSGSIPDTLGNLVELETLDFGSLWDSTSERYIYNVLTGLIPPALGKLINLEELDLDNNQLSGSIPPELGNLGNIEIMHLYGNELSGPIPLWLGTLTNLTSLALSRNELTGPIPWQLGTLTNLTSLALSRNELTGPIPWQLGTLTNLTYLYLNENRLTGTIPPELGDLGNLISLGLFRNELTGPIPWQLGTLTNLIGLYLNENRLTGTIPPELGDLGNLENLFLYENPLTGPIPQSLTRLSLRYFWIHATDVCAPADAPYQAWIATIANFRGDTCGRGGGAFGPTTPPTLDLTCHGYDEGATRAYNCIPVPSQQHHMGTFVPAVGSACDQGSIAEFPAGRIVFQIRCRDGSLGQSAAWWHSGQGPGFFVKPTGTPRVWVRTSFLGSSVHLSVWCRAPQENLVVNELLGTSWGNDGTSGIYGMAGCREVEVDTAGEDLQWWFAQELAATALTPPRSWEQVTGADSALPVEALQDLATAAELERRWRQPDRWGMNPGQGANTRGAVLTSDDDGGTRLDLRIAFGPDGGPDALDGAPLRSATRTSPLTLDLTCHGYNEGAARGTRAYNCIPEPSQQRYMRTFVPAVGSACDRGSIAEFPAGRIVFQIRCRDGSAGQSGAWSYSGQGPAFFEKPVDTSRVGVRTSFSGSSVHLSVWCRAPQEHLVVNELLGTSWGNDGTNGIYGMAGCREVEVDTGGGEDLQWWFTQDLAATALTPPRSWEQVSGGGRALPAEARQDLATATELERLWSRPGR